MYIRHVHVFIVIKNIKKPFLLKNEKKGIYIFHCYLLFYQPLETNIFFSFFMYKIFFATGQYN